MLARIRSIWLAGGGALALTLALSGVVAAGAILSAFTAPTTTTTVDTTASFEDLDGNGIDDDCEQAAVVPNPSAAASAEAAVDLNADGTISVSEAAQSDRVGGTNCNHGGYVSWVAHGACGTAEVPASSGEPAASSEPEPAASGNEDANEDAESADCTEDTTETVTSECENAGPAASGEPLASSEPLASGEPVTEDVAPNAHGKAVSAVAQSDAIGGKNCNHGGAVSAAAKKDHDAAKQARELAKAAREAAREAAKSERAGARHARTHGNKHDG
jgi:hypothetical protein